MRIRRIEIEQFRCIQNRVVLDLGGPGAEVDFAAIVGPNGSGKTSLIEAVTGVLRGRLMGNSFNLVGSRQDTRILVDSDKGQWEWTPRSSQFPDVSLVQNVLYVPATRDPALALDGPLHPGLRDNLGDALALSTAGSTTVQRMQVIHQWLMHERMRADVPALWRAVESFLEGGRYVGVDPIRHDLIFEFHGGARVGFNELSGGQRSLILLLAEIFLHCGEDGLLLWDEPEAHLHPAWQRRLRSTLPVLLPRGQIIVATHSPFMIDGLAAEQLFILGALDAPVRATG